MPFATCALTLPQRTATGKKKKRGEKTAYVRQLTQRQYRMALQHRPDFFFFIKTTKNEKLSKNSLVQISVHIHICMYKQPNTHTQKKKRCGFIAFYARCHASERQEKKKKRYSILKKEQRLKYKNRKTQKDREELVIKKRREDLYKKHIFIYKWNHTENTEKTKGGKTNKQKKKNREEHCVQLSTPPPTPLPFPLIQQQRSQPKHTHTHMRKNTIKT